MLPDFDEGRLRRDMAYRRQVAWQLVASVLAPAPVRNADLLPGYEDQGERTIPLWLTWYDSYEFAELFDMLYGSPSFGRVGREQGRPFTPAALGAVFTEHSQKQLLGWTEERFSHELGKLKFLRDLQGLVKGQDGIPDGGGRGMTAFSPELIRHLLENYAAVGNCDKRLKGVDGTAPPADPANFSVCLDAEFPGAAGRDHGVAIAVKATWHKVKSTSGLLQSLPFYRHDAKSLAQALADGQWSNRAGEVLPTPADIFTVRVDEDKLYMLTGLHIMSKQARHWLWTTLWWAPDADEDFGADRPDSVKALGRGLDRYKMCVVADYAEADPAPWSAFEAAAPLPQLSAEQNAQRALRLAGLAASLRAVHQQAQSDYPNGAAPTWCSNPYIELGAHNDKTNCIGCHQHAGSDVFGDDTLADDARFPGTGRVQRRRNFPTDYLWSLMMPPDDFTGRMDEVRAKYEE
jgi:hypothetical protein